MGNEEEREELKKWWYKMRREAGEKIILKIFRSPLVKEEIADDRNDVCMYKTLRYPPKSVPPTIN